MKTFSVVYADSLDAKSLKKIDASLLKIIKHQIETKLMTRPEVFGKPLRKSLKGYRRMRVGDMRVIFKIEDHVIKVVFIGKKPEVYKLFERKIS